MNCVVGFCIIGKAMGKVLNRTPVRTGQIQMQIAKSFGSSDRTIVGHYMTFVMSLRKNGITHI